MKDIPDDYDFIPKGTSIFQFKASESAFNPKRNFLTGRKEENPELKPLLKELIKNGATYVYIDTKKILTTDQKRGKERKIIEFIKEYSDTTNVKVHVYSADDVARWADKYIELRLKFNKIGNAMDFKRWKKRINERLSTKFLFTDNLKSLSLRILNLIRFDDLEIKYFQVKGPQGVGKKTFIVHTLDKLDESIKQNTIIIRALNEEISKTLEIIIHSQVNNGILIFDTVNSEIFEKIYSKLEWLTEKNYKVIAIYDNYIYTQKKYEKSYLLDITPFDQENAEKFVQELDSSLSFIVRHNVLHLSGGIPGMIIELISLFRDENFNIYEDITIKSLCEGIIEKLTRESGYEKSLLIQILIGFSLFSELGWETAKFQGLFYDDFVEKFQGNQDKFCNLLDINTDRYKVDILVNYLLKKGILSMRGRYILVKIRPLANYMIEEYVQERKIIKYLNKIWELDDIHFLIKFLERMKDIAYTIGNRIVRQILDSDFISDWKDFQDPYTSLREDLIPKSKIFLELTKLDHKLASDKLKELFRDVEPIQLKQDLTKRRNLIYALEHIVWYEETFNDGMNLLLKLAIGENENYANNASGVFKDKFSIYLPGTSVSLNKRIKYLISLKNLEDIIISNKILDSISQIFDLRDRVRTISAEIQSVKPIPEEYKTVTNEEGFNYLNSAFDLLKSHMESQNPVIVDRSCKILFEIIPTLLDYDLWNDIPSLLRSYSEKNVDNSVKLMGFITSLKGREENFVIPRMVNDLYNKIISNPDIRRDSNQFIKDLMAEIDEEQAKMSYKSSNDNEKEKLLKELIGEKIRDIRHFHEWDKLIKEIQSNLSLIERIKVMLSEKEWFFGGMGEMRYDEFRKYKATQIASNIY